MLGPVRTGKQAVQDPSSGCLGCLGNVPTRLAPLTCTPAGPAYDKIFTVVTGPVMVRPIGPDHPAVSGRYADHGRLLLRPASRGRAPACACALLICPGVRRVSRMRNLSPCSDSSFCCVFKDGQRCPSRLPQLVARRSGRRSGGSDTRSSSAMTSLHPSCHMCKNGVALCPPHSPSAPSSSATRLPPPLIKCTRVPFLFSQAVSAAERPHMCATGLRWRSRCSRPAKILRECAACMCAPCVFAQSLRPAQSVRVYSCIMFKRE